MLKPLLLLAAMVMFVSPVFSQRKPASSAPQDKPRKIKEEPKKAFTNWSLDVDPIISPEELNAWKKLQTDEERERFIEEFWRRRDPDPATEETEYREPDYKRIAYVNKHLNSGIPGIKTDRGRIYWKYGNPTETDAHTSGAQY